MDEEIEPGDDMFTSFMLAFVLTVLIIIIISNA